MKKTKKRRRRSNRKMKKKEADIDGRWTQCGGSIRILRRSKEQAKKKKTMKTVCASRSLTHD